jgi:uncharacterized protein
MKGNIYIVPRWSGTEHSDWYDWFKGEVEINDGYFVQALPMPYWSSPTIAEATNYLVREIPAPDESAFFIGHSVGCLALLHYVQEIMSRNSSIKIGGVLMVAGWFEVDETWDAVMPWLDNEGFNFPLFQENIDQKRVIVSDNDPFTSNYEANAALWRDRLGAEVTVCPGKAHFNSRIEPDVLAEFRKMIRESPAS